MLATGCSEPIIQEEGIQTCPQLSRIGRESEWHFVFQFGQGLA